MFLRFGPSPPLPAALANECRRSIRWVYASMTRPGRGGRAARRSVAAGGGPMSIYEHMSEFAGLPVVDWEPETGTVIRSGTAYRLTVSWEEAPDGQRWTDKLAAFLSSLGLRHSPAAQPASRKGSSWAGKLSSLLDDPGAGQV